MFKKPPTLGLNELAETWRKERQQNGDIEEPPSKRQRTQDGNPSWRSGWRRDGRDADEAQDRQQQGRYRNWRDRAQTPSHPGGVNQEALQRRESREREHRDSRMMESTKRGKGPRTAWESPSPLPSPIHITAPNKKGEEEKQTTGPDKTPVDTPVHENNSWETETKADGIDWCTCFARVFHLI